MGAEGREGFCVCLVYIMHVHVYAQVHVQPWHTGARAALWVQYGEARGLCGVACLLLSTLSFEGGSCPLSGVRLTGLKAPEFLCLSLVLGLQACKTGL